MNDGRYRRWGEGGRWKRLFCNIDAESLVLGGTLDKVRGKTWKVNIFLTYTRTSLTVSHLNSRISCGFRLNWKESASSVKLLDRSLIAGDTWHYDIAFILLSSSAVFESQPWCSIHLQFSTQWCTFHPHVTFCATPDANKCNPVHRMLLHVSSPQCITLKCCWIMRLINQKELLLHIQKS